METSIYIGNDKLDYNEVINCEYSIMDFREFQSGSNNTSYTINLPLTDLNRKLLKYSDSIAIIDEVLEDALIFIDDVQILKGKIKVLACDDKYIKVIISANEYLKGLEDKTLQDLVTTSLDFTHNATNIVNSWSAANGFFYRYPHVEYGTSMVDENIYIPYFNIKTILDYIFSTIGFTISSTFLTSSWFKDLYFTPKEFINDSEFLEDKDFNYRPTNNTDNEYIEAVPNGSTGIDVDFLCDPVVLDFATVSNTDFNTGFYRYTCPTSGTYKFEASIRYFLSLGGAVRTGGSTTIEIRRNGTAIATDSTAFTASATRVLTTDYIHCGAGDDIDVYVLVTQTVNNTSGGSVNVTQYLITTNTYLKMVTFSELNRYLGYGYPLKVNKWMQDTSLIDFVIGIKQIFNLCFFVDNWNKTIYIEPFETFIGSNVNIIENVEYMSKSKEFIAKDWSKTIHLDFKDDEKDIALQEYNNKYLTKSCRKTISLNSVYNKQDIETYENSVFSPFGNYSHLKVYDILGSRLYRLNEFNSKICHWDGLTGTFGIVFDGTTYPNYPKVSVLDMATLYGTYFNKYFHLIDHGVMITITAPTDLKILTQLNTVINTASNEGFRALYQFDYEGETHLGVLQAAVTDGYKTKYTLLLIK